MIKQRRKATRNQLAKPDSQPPAIRTVSLRLQLADEAALHVGAHGVVGGDVEGLLRWRAADVAQLQPREGKERELKG